MRLPGGDDCIKVAAARAKEGVKTMKSTTVCFTGHRKMPPERLESAFRRLKAVLAGLIDSGYTDFLAGGALGFDTLAAQAVLELRAVYPHIRLILVLPCLSQADGWSEENRREYERIQAQADEVVYTAQQYTRGCMHRRNRYLVEHSDVCLCWLTEPTGGTAYTVRYAAAQGLAVRNIAEEDK